jgi:hypothetical protein
MLFKLSDETRSYVLMVVSVFESAEGSDPRCSG